MNEQVDRRILGAFVCVDSVTQESVTYPMQAAAPHWALKPNRSGIYVIFNGPGFSAQTGQFLPATPWPAPVSFEVTLQDPNRKYLPRRANVQAPQSVPDIPPPPAGSSTNPAALAALQNPATVFDPQRVAVYRTPSAAVGPNWASIHASVTRLGSAPAQGLPWAVLRVTRNSDSSVLAVGVSDASGEALLAVPGLTLQASNSGVGPVTVSTVAVTVTAYFDPAILTQLPGWIPNPDDVLGNLANPALKSASQVLQLSAGQQLPLSLAISV